MVYFGTIVAGSLERGWGGGACRFLLALSLKKVILFGTLKKKKEKHVVCDYMADH